MVSGWGIDEFDWFKCGIVKRGDAFLMRAGKSDRIAALRVMMALTAPPMSLDEANDAV